MVDVEYSLLNQLIFVLATGVVISLIGIYLIGVYLTKQALDPIKKSWENQVLFVQDSSHELRTPLTILFSKLENMIKNPEHTINEEVENIAEAMNEVRHLRQLVKNLLSLTKEDAISKVNKEEFDLVILVKDIMSTYKEIAEIQGKKLEYDYSKVIMKVNSDKEKIKQLFTIFIDNAFKYTKEKDYIKISLNEESNFIKISIKDSGVGISEEEIPLIFNRFFRSENVRNKNIEGSGIGLSIAKVIISNLKGNIHVSSKLGEGTVFHISIPRK